MTRLLTALALVAAWWLGRDHERRQVRAMDERADEMDGVQWDPWTVPRLYRWHCSGCGFQHSGTCPDTYIEAAAQAAIRRSAQRDDVTTEGTS
jgi:hypothetical protein